MNKLRKGMLLVAVIVAVSVIILNTCASEKELTANSTAKEETVVCAAAIKPLREPIREDFLPEKTRNDRIALRAAMPCDNTIPEQKPVRSAAAESAVETEYIPVPEAPAVPVLPAETEFGLPSAPPPEPDSDPEPSYSSNGWQPVSAEHYHGTGTDSGICPACGLLYGPAGGTEGQYTAQDGLMD